VFVGISVGVGVSTAGGSVDVAVGREEVGMGVAVGGAGVGRLQPAVKVKISSPNKAAVPARLKLILVRRGMTHLQSRIL
jgi:hypothetical protein